MKVVGITIGPIAETIALAKSPAMLWYASAFFSKLTFTLCKNISEQMEQVTLYAPFIEAGVLQKGEFSIDGIGKYHDRIIFETNSTSNLEEVIQKSKREIAEMISCDKNGTASEADTAFLMQYFQVHYVVVEKAEITGSVIGALTDPLNALEQMRSFSLDNTNHTLLQLFGADQFRNAKISTCAMLKDVQNSQLKNENGTFRSIPDIAGSFGTNGSGIAYYAVLQADGDRMGRYFEQLSNEEIQAFSTKCIRYAEEASKLIGSFGGMTIYAGGDDLLAIVPVLKRDNTTQEKTQTIFDLCAEILNCFRQHVQEENTLPTVSLGIAIRHGNFPLYEALTAAEDAIFRQAKAHGGNSIAVDFQQYNGHELKLKIEANSLSFVNKFVNAYHGLNLSSVLYMQDGLKTMLETGKDTACSKETIKNIFLNMFDSAQQKKYQPYMRELSDVFYQLTQETEGKGVSVYDCGKYSAVETLEGLLRLKKFFALGT